MKRLLLQSDDYGMTCGVTEGTLHAIRDGFLKNTGMFVNMKSSAYAAERIRDMDVCLGIDINLACGRPVSDPKLVSHLIGEDGRFRSSRTVLKENRLLKTDRYLYYFEHDPYIYEEVLTETRAQVERFIELNGRLPEYINAHSIMTENTEKAAKAVKEEFGIKGHSSDFYFGEGIDDLSYMGDYEVMTPEQQIKLDMKDLIIKKVLPSMREDRIGFFCCHCGFIDRDLLQETSYTFQRMNDTALICDPDLAKAIEDNHIELITYRDL